MASKTYRDVPEETPSYGSVLKELGQSAKDLVQSEIRLMTAEFRVATQKVTRHAAQAAIFGGLLVVSIFPFLAFLVIGLGDLLDGRYWLSSLIVAVVCASVGGTFAYSAYKKIKTDDLDFHRTRNSLDRDVQVVQNRMNEIKNAARGDRHEYDQFHH